MSFFSEVLPKSGGWTPLIRKGPKGGLTIFKWFRWPDQHKDMLDFVESYSDEDVYFSPFLYKEPPGLNNTRHARKDNVTACSVVWSDGDGMDLDKLRVKPDVLVWSSENHWQGYWLFLDAERYSPAEFEAMSHGLYNAHAFDGMDRGWPLAKKMRVPGTTNTKYDEPFKLEVSYREPTLTVDEFCGFYEPAEQLLEFEDEEMPIDIPSPYEVLGRIQRSYITDIFLEDIDEYTDRSARLYHLECLLWEEDCTDEEVFAVVRDTKFNKFAADGRGDEGLWHQLMRDKRRWETTRAYIEHDTNIRTGVESVYAPKPISGLQWSSVSLLSPEEESPVDTFIDAFVFWASQRSKQSPAQYHVCGALALLSQVLARYAYIPLSFGKIPLNLYFMVLGRTTQSRKSTSLRLAQRVTRAIDSENEYLIPEDTTAEALALYLAERPMQSSILAVDEVQDLFQAASRKTSYLANLVGFVTKAFDGNIPGQIRKTGDKTLVKSVPHYMSFYGTGILNLTAKYLTPEKIETGFVPRCLVAIDDREEFIIGSDDLEYIRDEMHEARQSDAGEGALARLLSKRIKQFEEVYNSRSQFLLENEDARFPVKCEAQAFERWKQFARDAMDMAANHDLHSKELFPTIERMTMSTLKIACLLALAEGKDEVMMRHMIKAISLASIWMPSSEVFVKQVTYTEFSKTIDDIVSWVASRPDGRTTFPALLAKFQNKFTSIKQFSDSLGYAQKRGLIQEEVKGREAEDRYIVFTGKGK